MPEQFKNQYETLTEFLFHFLISSMHQPTYLYWVVKNKTKSI